jgi:hypothetical protein
MSEKFEVPGEFGDSLSLELEGVLPNTNSR